MLETVHVQIDMRLRWLKVPVTRVQASLGSLCLLLMAPAMQAPLHLAAVHEIQMSILLLVAAAQHRWPTMSHLAGQSVRCNRFQNRCKMVKHSSCTCRAGMPPMQLIGSLIGIDSSEKVGMQVYMADGARVGGEQVEEELPMVSAQPSVLY